LMPALSPTMEKGNLAKWLKKEGDAIKAGDVIAEIETDKATMEYESIDDGVLAKIVVPEGTQDVAVNALIAVLAQEGEDHKAAAAATGKETAPARAPQAGKVEPAVASPSTGTSSPQPSPLRGEGAERALSQRGSAASAPGRGAAPAPVQDAATPQAQMAPSPRRGEGGGEGVEVSQSGT